MRLFCIDTNEHGRRPFYDLLLKRGYARWHEGDLAVDEGLAVASERRKWRARGDELLARIKEGDESIADRAALCFAKSGDAASEAFCRGVEWRRGALRAWWRAAKRGNTGVATWVRVANALVMLGGALMVLATPVVLPKAAASLGMW